MALIKCPECNQEVSDKAKTCPHCGNPMKKVSMPDMSKLKKKPSKNLIIVCIAAVAVIALIGFASSRSRDPYDQLAQRVEEIQKNPQLADADQIESDIKLMNKVSEKWTKETNEVIDDIISIWEDSNRIAAGAEEKNRSFTKEYTKGALSAYIPVRTFMNSDFYKDYQSVSETVESNMTVLNRYKNDSVSQTNYISQELVDRSDRATVIFVLSDHLYNIASKEVGIKRAYANYTPSYSTEGGTTYLYPEFLAEDINNIELNDYCKNVNQTRDHWDYEFKKANE